MFYLKLIQYRWCYYKFLLSIPDLFWRDWFMIKVEFSFYSHVCCPQQYIQKRQTTETSKELCCWCILWKNITFCWKIHWCSPFISRWQQNGHQTKILLLSWNVIFFNTKQSSYEHLFRKDFARFFYSHMKFSWLSFTCL